MQPPANWSFQSPVPYEVLTGNGVPEVFTYQSPTENQATADFITQWDNRFTVIQYLLGTGVYGIGPVRHPDRTDLFARRAATVGMNAQGLSGNWASYEFAKLNVTFTPNPSGQVGNDNTTGYITVDSEAAAEWQTLPGRELTWLTGAFTGKPLSEQAHILSPKNTHRVSVHQWFNPPFAAMDAALGKVNSLPVRWVGRTIGSTCLMFENYHESVDVYLFGQQTYKVEMTFQERPRNWNMFLTPGAQWEAVTPSPYTSTSFAGIFP